NACKRNWLERSAFFCFSLHCTRPPLLSDCETSVRGGRRVSFGRNPTNRWTGATGSAFRIKRNPAKLLGSAVARSTQTLDVLVNCAYFAERRKQHETE